MSYDGVLFVTAASYADRLYHAVYDLCRHSESDRQWQCDFIQQLASAEPRWCQAVQWRPRHIITWQLITDWIHQCCEADGWAAGTASGPSSAGETSVWCVCVYQRAGATSTSSTSTVDRVNIGSAHTHTRAHTHTHTHPSTPTLLLLLTESEETKLIVLTTTNEVTHWLHIFYFHHSWNTCCSPMPAPTYPTDMFLLHRRITADRC